MSELKIKEKIGYAMGDVASNFYWRVFDAFLFIFYTDVFGLSPAAVGTLMLVTRLIDAFSDPLMGTLADRTNTRFGKFRPYLLWGIMPIAAAGVLLFTVPDLDDSGKLVWAYATYIFMMLAYTFINLPYGALLGVVTQDTQSRTSLSSFRFIGASLGGTLVAFMTPELVAYLGGENEILGWQLTMTLYGFITAILFSTTFFSVKERIAPPKNQTVSFVQDLKDLSQNKPWLVLFGLALIIMLTISIRSSVGTYYFKYVVEREDLIGTFTAVFLISFGVGAAITPILTKYVDKKRLLLILMSLVTLFSVLFYFVPSGDTVLVFILQIAIGLCLGPKSPLVFSMYADTADYSEWKNGRRSTAMIFAAAAFSQKLGGAIAGATIGYVLSSLGYVANAEQSPDSLLGIVLLISIIPGFFALLSVFMITRYSLSNDELIRCQKVLDERRSDPNY
ncbi:MFS transporter [Glaciecola petra]|uniref:MFS transporter n=1 Tax=Glaciecola petra TaxID=3075602 RepID=A0ABU2ZUL5_9ALTE|nr:MFS transporter [Aestuariibacter sp. P117]MDT0595279.1 MFS transporter [Aestuariibacter sp. P117]